jgi:hypothetical protein
MAAGIDARGAVDRVMRVVAEWSFAKQSRSEKLSKVLLQSSMREPTGRAEASL